MLEAQSSMIFFFRPGASGQSGGGQAPCLCALWGVLVAGTLQAPVDVYLLEVARLFFKS